MSLLSVLTEDLLFRVLQYIESEPDRKSCRLVCKDFNRVESLTRKSIRVIRVKFLLSMLRKFTAIETLDLSVCSYINDRIVAMLVSQGLQSWTQGLRCLKLSRVTGLRYPGLEQLVRACPFLERLDLSNCITFGDREANAVSFARGLRELNMDKCLGLSDVGLAKIAIGCSRLERLSIKWCSEIGDLGVDLLCKKCRDLKFVDVSYLMVTSEALKSFASLPKLEALIMLGCPLVDDTGLQFLGFGCPSLRVIDISRCECITSFGLVSMIKGHTHLVQLNASHCFSELCPTLLQSLKDLKDLRRMRMDGARVSISFQTISTYCKSLEELGLSKCKGVNSTGIIQLVSGCINLKFLDLTCCRSVDDAAISAIANSCRKLVSLKVESCNMITEKSLDQLGSCCPLLEEVDFTDCSGINDKGLEFLSRCSELSCLKLGVCVNISNKGLSYIASKCSKICELDLYRCTGIGDDGLAVLSSGCKKLKNLNLSYCNEITDKGMECVSHLNELYSLELRGLLNITSVGLTAIAARCNKLAQLDVKRCKNINDSGFRAVAYHSRNLRQINLSNCDISDMALRVVMGNLTCLQQAKLVYLPNASVEGCELALQACCAGIRKIKLHNSLRLKISSDLLQNLHARGCYVKWE